MSENDNKFPWLIPALTVSDVDAALALYQKAFDFTPGNCIEDERGKTGYADMVYQGQVLIMLMRQGAWDGTAQPPAVSGAESAVGLYVYCDDVDARNQQTAEAGATAEQPPEDMFWGDRMAKLRDADGQSWRFATPIPGFTAQNPPG